MFKFDESTKALVPTPEKDTYMAQFQPLEALVRRSLLYFDQLILPTNDVIPQAELLHAESLQHQGVLKTIPIQLPVRLGPGDTERLKRLAGQPGFVFSGSGYRYLAEGHIQVFKALEERERGLWTFATVGIGIDVPSGLADFQQGVEMELYNCLPVPMDDAPYEDLLGFKEKHADELLALRARLDDIYLVITQNRDLPRAKSIEIRKLEEALVELRKSLDSSCIPYHLECQGVEITLGDVVHLGAAVAAALAGGPGSYIALSIAAGSLLKFAPKLDISSPIKRAGALKYIYLAEKESIVDQSSIAGDSRRSAPPELNC